MQELLAGPTRIYFEFITSDADGSAASPAKCTQHTYSIVMVDSLNLTRVNTSLA